MLLKYFKVLRVVEFQKQKEEFLRLMSKNYSDFCYFLSKVEGIFDLLEIKV